MIRFIDLRNQGTCHRFAFWCTTSNRFIRIAGEYAWNNVPELKEDWEYDKKGYPDIGRLLRHCESHPWTSEGEDDVVGWYDGETEEFTDVNAKLTTQRDELLAALKPVMEQLDGPSGEIVASYSADEPLIAALKAAIASCGVQS